MKGLYKYKITVFNHRDGDEAVYKGVVMAKNFSDATDKVVKAYEYYGTETDEYDVEVCDITISPVIDNEGKVDCIYEFEEN